METCELCRRPATKTNPLNNHHVRGKKNNLKYTMRVHSETCHVFADWITKLYIQKGEVEHLEAKHIIYFFTRVTSIREDHVLIMPVYR